MGETKWFRTFEEMRDYVSAESRGDAGEEFELKECKGTPPKKKGRNQGTAPKNAAGQPREEGQDG